MYKCKIVLFCLCIMPFFCLASDNSRYKFNTGIFHPISNTQKACAEMILYDGESVPFIGSRVMNEGIQPANYKFVYDLRINSEIVYYDVASYPPVLNPRQQVNGPSFRDFDIRTFAVRYGIRKIRTIELCEINSAQNPNDLSVRFSAYYTIHPPLPKN